MFGISPGNLFDVDSFAKRSLIISSVAAAIGLSVDVWFIFAYSGADVRKFHVSLPSPLRTCDVYDTDHWAIDARGGYLWLVLLLFPLITSTPRRTHHLRPRPGRLPLRRRLGGLAHCGARDVRDRWCVSEPTVHRVWLSSPRTVSRVDATWALVGDILCWEPVTGCFCAQPSQSSCHD